MKDKWKRNEDGLIESVEYHYNEYGRIDWRKMIDDKFLYPNKDWFLKREKDVPTSIDGLKDNQLLIQLGGIKELLTLRGFTSCKSKIIKCSRSRAVANCKINFIGNFETDGNEVLYEDNANATIDNTDGFSVKFLESIATNRAFIRCVRNFLNIHIVGADEIDKSEKKDEEDSGNKLSPQNLLERKSMQAGFKSFEQFKEDFLRVKWTEGSYKNKNTKDWSCYSQVPAKDARILINLLKGNE